MSASLSIVIPTLNAGEDLPGCLERLVEGLTSGLIRELIISDGGSTDHTLAIADEAGGRIVEGAASRGGQLRRGCTEAKGPWLLILHADTQLEPGWADAVAAHVQAAGAKPAYFRLKFRARGTMPTLVAGWANLRSRLFGLPYGDQGLLVSRRDYDRAGGYPDQPLMEDVALIRALPRATGLPVMASTSAERYLATGWLRRGMRNHWTMLRYRLGASPEALARSYGK